jgi:hypothetical protein
MQKTKQPVNAAFKVINNALARNRKILDSVLPDGEEIARASKEKLLAMGFHFKYLTHTYTTKKGKIYFYCYEYGYLPIEKDWYLVVKKKGE